MVTFFDIYSVSLLITSLAVFIIRYFRQEPPVTPYLVIACTCAVANWLGESGGEYGALALLIAASFLFLACVLYPRWRDMTDSANDKTDDIRAA